MNNNELAPHNAELSDGQSAQMTPEQSRQAAVSNLITTSLARAGTLLLTSDESKKLIAEFPDSDFQPGAGGNAALIYIEHAALRNRLNGVLGLGQWALIVRETWNENFKTAKGQACQRVYARVMMMIRGCYVGEAVGDMTFYPNNGVQNYGDAFEGAKTAAFRRCAKEFGIGLQAWQKDWCAGWWARKNGTAPRKAAPPQAAPAQRSAPEQPKAAPTEYPEGYDPDLEDLTPPEGMDFGPETSADAPADESQDAPQGDYSKPIQWTGVFQRWTPAKGRGPITLYGVDGKSIFKLWPKNEAIVKKLTQLWNPPKNQRKYLVDALEERKGEYVDNIIQDINPA